MIIRVVEPNWKYDNSPRVIVATTQAEADQKHFERCVQDHYSYRDMAIRGEEALRADIDEAVSEGNYTKALNLYFLSEAFLSDDEAPRTLAEEHRSEPAEEELADYKEALQEVAELAAGDGDATVKMARLALSFSGMEEAGLIELP